MQRLIAWLTGSRVRLLETQLQILNAGYAELGQAHARLQAQLDHAKKQETYWQRRAEKLIDSALVRSQAISEPVMVAPELSEMERARRSVIGSLSMTTFPKTS